MSAEIESLTRQEDRKFGYTFAAIVAVLFGFVLPWLFDFERPVVPFAIAAVFVVWATVRPTSLVYFYKPWMRFATVVGFVNSRILLSIIFYLLFTPIALIIKLIGKDAMSRKVYEKSDQESYWIPSEKPQAEEMENMY